MKQPSTRAQAPVKATEAPAPAANTTTLYRDDKPRKDTAFTVYTLPGGGQVYFPAARISGAAPDSIEIVGLSLAPAATPKAKMTEEERKAAAEARKNETPLQKAERAAAIAAKATERAAKLQALVGLTEAEYKAAK